MTERTHVTEREPLLLEVPYIQPHGHNIVVERIPLDRHRDIYQVLWVARFYGEDENQRDIYFASLYMRMEFSGMFVATTPRADINLIVNTLTNGFTSLAEDLEGDERLGDVASRIDWDNEETWKFAAWAVTTDMLDVEYMDDPDLHLLNLTFQREGEEITMAPGSPYICQKFIRKQAEASEAEVEEWTNED